MKKPKASPGFKAILKECCLEAEQTERQLHKIVQCLRQGNHLGALGEFAGLDDRIQYIRAVLMRAARTSAVKTRR